MTGSAVVMTELKDLRGLVDRAAQSLADARTSAEILDAREMAGIAYDVAKRVARLRRAKDAHDALISAAHRAQAHALEIESKAKHRLADEYDGAQQRGEIQRHGGDRVSKVSTENLAPTVSDLGLTRKEVHDARVIRDAEHQEPGIVRRALDARLELGEEPTRTALRKMVTDAAMRGLRPQRSPSRRNPLYVPPTSEQAAWQHVTGTFRSFAEWASEANLALARAGMLEAQNVPFHDLDVRAIAQGSAVFITIKEWFDA